MWGLAVGDWRDQGASRLGGGINGLCSGFRGLWGIKNAGSIHMGIGGACRVLRGLVGLAGSGGLAGSTEGLGKEYF